jgi:hypothetical protein
VVPGLFVLVEGKTGSMRRTKTTALFVAKVFFVFLFFSICLSHLLYKVVRLKIGRGVVIRFTQLEPVAGTWSSTFYSF